MYNVKMLNDGKATFGIFKNLSEVRSARLILNSLGFANSDIAVLYPSRKGPQDFEQRRQMIIKKGALIGSAVGGVVFFVISIFMTAQMGALGALASINPPPNLWALMTLNVVGLFSGLILGAAAGAMVGMGIPERAARRYGDYVDAGGILMSVHVEDAEKAHAAQAVLERTGAQDVNLLKETDGWNLVYSKVSENQKDQKPSIDLEN
jgi:uncharacterized membrane protein